jgi:hypothetical protein
MARLWELLILLFLIALGGSLLTLEETSRPEWVDVMALWNPRNEEPGSRYRFSLPCQDKSITVTLIKNMGGSHNRFWELLIERSERSVATIRESWPETRPWPKVGQQLTHHGFLASNDTLFGPDPRPGIYYQPWQGSYRFLVYQPACNPGFDFEEGWSIWHPDQEWTRCDRWGRLSITPCELSPLPARRPRPRPWRLP